MLGEVTPGGTGSGLYTMLVYAIIAVFIGGLMIGRTPEYLGKKIQAREIKLAGLAALVMPITVLIVTALAVSLAVGVRDPRISAPRIHRDSVRPDIPRQQQRFGLRRTHRQQPVLQHHRWDRHVARPIRDHDPGSRHWRLARGEEHRTGVARTFRTDNGMFVGLVIGVILIIGGLTFFPPSRLDQSSSN